MCRRLLVNSDMGSNRQKTLQTMFCFHRIVNQNCVFTFLSFVSLNKAAVTFLFFNKASFSIKFLLE